MLTLNYKEFVEQVPTYVRKLGIENIQEWNILESVLPYDIEVAEVIMANDLAKLYPPKQDEVTYNGKVETMISIYKQIKR